MTAVVMGSDHCEHLQQSLALQESQFIEMCFYVILCSAGTRQILGDFVGHKI